MSRLLLILLTMCSLAAAETRLDQLLRWQRQAYAGAVVTSGFYETRGLSRYRSRPGLHAGYDIAMPAGSGARAAWPATVRSLIPWAEGEWGVEVAHEDGTTATYGHILPRVEVGQKLEPGQVVGLIARDHLDVKMRDLQGSLFDYGSGSCIPQQAVRVSPLPGPRALAFQSQLRRMAELEALDRRSYGILRQSGLRVKQAPSGTRLEELEKIKQAVPAEELRLLTWNARDQERAEACRRHAAALEYRYELGLVSRNRWQAARRRARLWEVIFVGCNLRLRSESAKENKPPQKGPRTAQEHTQKKEHPKYYVPSVPEHEIKECQKRNGRTEQH